MPGARAHDMITLITAGIADGVYFAAAPHPNTKLAALFTVAYLFAGYACAGDLDLMSTEYRHGGRCDFCGSRTSGLFRTARGCRMAC